MSEHGQSLVAQWNEALLDAIRSGSALPTETTYQLFIAHAAIYDAWAAYDDAASTYASGVERPAAEHSDAAKAEAISYAAYTVLSQFFPDQQAKFDALMNALGYDPAETTTDLARPAGVGNHAAEAIFAARAGDGSNYSGGYADTTGYAPVNSADPMAANAPAGPDFDPNHWQPLRVPTGSVVDPDTGVAIVDPDDPASYSDQIALTPHWGDVDPFALASGDAASPPPPPQFGDPAPYTDARGVTTSGHEAYVAQMHEVVEFSAGLTPKHKLIAEFWADGPRTESPPGHWKQFGQDLALRDGHGIDEDAKMFFALNGSILDAGIAAWDAKYAFDYVRPQSAIRDFLAGQEIAAWAGPNLGTGVIPAEHWQPYQKLTFVTPPFPEFVSGHSAFSAAAAETLTAFLGTNAFYDGVTRGAYDLDDVEGVDLLGQYVGTRLLFEDHDGAPIVLQWKTLQEAADEAGLSRLYGGIHFQDGDLRGRELGRTVAETGEAHWRALFENGDNDNIHALKTGGLILAGAGDDMVRGKRGADNVKAGTGDDTVLGRGGEDVILGEAGDDTLKGGGRNDVIDGGAGSDRISGDGGRDAIAGGDDADALSGGGGADCFLFRQGETGVDVIEDFGRGRDKIVLSGFGAPEEAEVEVLSARGDLTLTINGERVALLHDARISEIEIGRTLVFDDGFDLMA